MKTLCRSLAGALLAGVVGCGGGGIEAGMPANPPTDLPPAKKQQLQDMGKMMLKGPKAYEGTAASGS